MKKFRFLFVLVIALVFAVGCRVQFKEGDSADLNVAWTCLYRTGQALQCPSNAIGTVKGKTVRVANNLLGISSNRLASALVTGAASHYLKAAIPYYREVQCIGFAGKATCWLVRKANMKNISVVSKGRDGSVTRQRFVKVNNLKEHKKIRKLERKKKFKGKKGKKFKGKKGKKNKIKQRGRVTGYVRVRGSIPVDVKAMPSPSPSAS